MPKNKISEFSSTPANNTDIGGIDIAEGCAPSGINNAIRELMAQLKDQQAGTDADNFTVGGNLNVTGTSTLTGDSTIGGNLTVTGTITASSLNDVSSFKNKIIGGDFTTNPFQRGTSFVAVANGAYTADRWVNINLSSAVITASKSTDAPTAAQSGIFTQHSLGYAVTTADASIASGDVVDIQQRIEGLNAASLGFGQAGTRSVTISFWVKGAKAGIHCVALTNGANNRSYVSEYTINVINTWEKKVITIPVDTAGTWLYDNGLGLNIIFTLVSGTTYQTTANTWTNGNFVATANQVNEVDTIGNNFKIALVQLEAGATATQFETRSVGTELALCQRYFQILNGVLAGITGSGISNAVSIPFPVEMRITPPSIINSAQTNINTTSAGFNSAGEIYAVFGSTGSASGGYISSATGQFSAEL